MLKSINFLSTVIFILASFVFLPEGISQKKKKKEASKELNSESSSIDELSLSSLQWRNVGPALTSGRIADMAIHPENSTVYYVATASGGVWKTVNNGTTYQAIFDSQGSYSIGCVTIDPSNYNTIWVGTGENNNQRSVAYGDGIYKSEDGGSSWKHMGLKNSEHIGRIIVHPGNSDIVYVAAIGPLWSKGGDRGVYKTMDGGSTWECILELDEHTGVNDIIMDPRNPDILYASALQRRRHVYTYVGGGPGSGMYTTKDGGENWGKINAGLPSTEIGRIGLCISPADPDYIYAIVEAAEGKGGFYRTTNQGANWERRSGHVTSGNYYQEIIPDPINPDKIYSMDTWMKVCHDGGKSFRNVGEDTKHVDNHAMWINPQNTDHWLVGCDGGLYETYDAAATWDFKKNLPVTQFYKVALDNEAPFYNIYGGTQDNFSLGGPSRVTNKHGITNSDWFITHGGDGFESQVDPNNPDIVYAQSQYGVLVRYDRKSGEELGIQPKERKGENGYRWNWDAPLIASPHSSGRVYFAAEKAFRSDDYGNSWTVISEDLTRNIDRNTLKVYDRIVGMDAVMKNSSTSLYGTIVAMTESSVNPDLLAVGTDDGLVQITTDGGGTWRKIDNIPGAPSRSYVNSICLSQHDEKVMYVAFNHHKYGDFKPYIFRSADGGATWKKITGKLPERGSIYSIEEDHVDANLLFCGAEFGVFFSSDAGMNWRKLGSDLPTIAVRDIAVQRRENDLVLGTFGRGFYVLDDYSSLRHINSDLEKGAARIFPIRDALQWEMDVPLGLPGKSFQGDNYYSASNLGPEVLIRYRYHGEFKSKKDERQKDNKAKAKDKKDIPYPSYDILKEEREEISPKLEFLIRDMNGKVVKRYEESPSDGLKTLKWDMRYVVQGPINLSSPSFYNPFAGVEEGSLVTPGDYTVELSISENGEYTSLVEAQKFKVVSLDNKIMAASNMDEKTEFQNKIAALSSDISVAQNQMSEMRNKMRYIKEAINRSAVSVASMRNLEQEVKTEMDEISTLLYGDNIKSRLDIGQAPTPATRIGWIEYEQKYSSSAPTKTHQDSYNIAKEEFAPIRTKLDQLISEKMGALEKMLIEAGAPYTPGRGR